MIEMVYVNWYLFIMGCLSSFNLIGVFFAEHNKKLRFNAGVLGIFLVIYFGNILFNWNFFLFK